MLLLVQNKERPVQLVRQAVAFGKNVNTNSESKDRPLNCDQEGLTVMTQYSIAERILIPQLYELNKYHKP